MNDNNNSFYRKIELKQFLAKKNDNFSLCIFGVIKFQY